MSVVDSPQPRPPAAGHGGTQPGSGASSHGPLARLARSPLGLALGACILLAILSAVVLPTVPSYDPFSWIVWGREVSDPHLSFRVSGGPSWKPLPFLFTTVWGLFGGAAPTLWVITARVGGLLGLYFAWRLARRLAGRGALGHVAGLLAVAGIVLTLDWPYYFLRGTSEVVLIGLTLGAIDRLLAGRRAQAYALAVAAGLIRPEWWPFIGLFAVYLWFRDPAWRTVKARLFILAGLALLPFLWFVPPWIGSGDPFLAASHAASYNGHLGSDKLRTVLARGVNLQVLPALIAAAVAVALGWWQRRDRLLLGLGLAVIAWWIVVVGMTLDGYPGLERFYLPAAAVTCVLGGIGIVRVAELAGGIADARRVPVTAAVVLVLVLVSIPLSSARISETRAAIPAANRAVATLKNLDRAVAAAGGHDGVFPCLNSFAAVNHGVQTALAWKLHVTLERVGTSMRAPGVDFVGPHNATDGAPAPVNQRLSRHQHIAEVAGWRVVRLTDPNLHRSTACVGR